MEPCVVDDHAVGDVNVCPHVQHAVGALHIGKLGKLVEALKPVAGHAQIRCCPRTRSGETSKNIDIAAAALAAGEYRIIFPVSCNSGCDATLGQTENDSSTN